MSEYLVKDTALTAVADAIRTKTGGTDELVFPDGFATAISEITTGIDAEMLENVPVTLDFSGGNQTVNAGDGYVVKTAIIQKPETLIPENIAAGVDIAGVTGTLVTGGGEPVLNMEETEVTFAEEVLFGEAMMMNTSEVDFNYVIEGATYDVVWDGTNYPCTAWKLETVIGEEPVVFIGIGNTAIAGTPSAEPFIIGTVNGEMRICSLFDAENHTVSVTLNLSADGNGDNSGGSDEPFALITVTTTRGGVAVAGAEVTATKGTTAVTGVTDENGKCELKVTEAGTYTIVSTYDGYTSGSSSVTIGSLSYSASNTFFSATITVATETGATVTVEKDGKTYTATGEDMQTVITVYETGTYNVTSSYNGNSLTKTVDVTASTNYKLSIFSSHLVLEDTSWSAISALSAEGNPQNYFSVGDTKSVHLNGQILLDTYDTTLYVYIIGFNHNESIEGKGIHFGTFKTAEGKDVALVDSKYGYAPNTDTFGFSHGNANDNGVMAMIQYVFGQTLSDYNLSSTTPYYIADDSLIDTPKTNSFMAALPTELRSVLKKFRKYHGEKLASKAYYADLFINLLSSYEVAGALTANEYDYSQYVKQYEYFAQGNSKVKYKHNATSTACIWYLRGDAKLYSNSYGITVNASGGVGQSSSPTKTYGFAPIFVV